jgi:hypothetical protein
VPRLVLLSGVAGAAAPDVHGSDAEGGQDGGEWGSQDGGEWGKGAGRAGVRQRPSLAGLPRGVLFRSTLGAILGANRVGVVELVAGGGWADREGREGERGQGAQQQASHI